MVTFSQNSKIFKYYSYFKWVIYALLALNIVLFFIHQTVVEGLDSLGWVVLLILFEYETTHLSKAGIGKVKKYLIHLGRMLSYILLVYVAYEYTTPEFIEQEGYLDMLNALTWFAIVGVLEYDIYFPIHRSRLEFFIRGGIKVVLYTALIVYAVLWGVEGKLLDFYDAFLWIVCFFFIELNIIKFEEEEGIFDS